MLIQRLAGCFIVVALASPAKGSDTACSALFLGSHPPALLNPKLAARTTLLCNDAYAVLASGITHGPIWSAEHLTAASVAIAEQTEREGHFHADDRLTEADQARLADYRHSGFDRGHMTPSGDMPGEAAQEQSFLLSNMVPQTAELNRGVWARIEEGVRDLATRDGELYVVTGPAFRGAELRTIGADGVLVPTSTWKAVYDPRVPGTGVYVCKNTAPTTCRIMPVAALVRVVGVDPFPAAPDGLKAVAMRLPIPRGRTGLGPPDMPSGWLERFWRGVRGFFGSEDAAAY